MTLFSEIMLLRTIKSAWNRTPLVNIYVIDVPESDICPVLPRHTVFGKSEWWLWQPWSQQGLRWKDWEKSRAFKQVWYTWNNWKSGAKLDLTSLTTPWLQIHKFDHTWTANPCDWLPCCHAALLLVGCPHSLVYLHLPVVEGLIFCISATPHLGTSFPLFHAYI